MTYNELNKLLESLKEISCLKEVFLLNQGTPKTAKYSFNLIGTKFFLDIIPINFYYYEPERCTFKICWEKREFIWRSYTFFEVIKEVPEEIGSELLFYINVFQQEGEARYKFPGDKD